MSLCINPSCPNPQNLHTQLFCQSCGSELLLEGRYRVIRELGSGGFGKTYEVSSHEDSIKVLKVLIKNHSKYIELFQREAQVLIQLNHPGIPKVEPDGYFTFSPYNSQEPLHCLVMEKIEGLDLYQYLTTKGSVIKEKRAIQWLLQIAKILQEVHKQNFFHRDIKPSNIMLRSNGQLVLIDFGTAREITSTYMAKQNAGAVTGIISAGYTPFEQMYGQASPQSDFFALARTFVFLLTGKDPSEFYDLNTNQLRWREIASDVSPQFADFLDYMMARSPNDRPQTAEVICQNLQEIYRVLYPSLASSNSISSTEFFAQQPTKAIPYIPSSGSSSVQSAASKAPQTLSQIQPGFLAHCQRELAEYIGPMASIICKRTITKNPELSPNEFVEVLATKIPNQKQAEAFQKSVLK